MDHLIGKLVKCSCHIKFKIYKYYKMRSHIHVLKNHAEDKLEKGTVHIYIYTHTQIHIHTNTIYTLNTHKMIYI